MKRIHASTMNNQQFSLHGKMLSIVLVVFIASVIGVISLWSPRTSSAQVQASDYITLNAVVTSARVDQCQSTSEDIQPDGSLPANVTCATVNAQITSDKQKGKNISVVVDKATYGNGIDRGTQIIVSAYTDPSTGGYIYSWANFDRKFPLSILASIFVISIFALGKWRGLLSIVGLVGAYLMIVFFIIPALQADKSAFLVGLCGVSVILCLVLYLSHGVNLKTTTALLGTMLSLVFSSALAAFFINNMHLNGVNGEEDSNLSLLTGLPNLSGLIMAGVIIASVGVLNDVTITQSSAVWELKRTKSTATFKELFASGMRIGRDHLSSTIYTIAFAYAGAALPALMLLFVYARPFSGLLSDSAIVEELMRTMVGSLGIIAAIPLTTALAAFAATRHLNQKDKISIEKDSTHQHL